MGGKVSERKLGLAERLLLRIAREQGPELDRIDVSRYVPGLEVRELLMEFVSPDGPSPTEVRVGLLDLIDQGYLAMSERDSLLDLDAVVRIRLRGLSAAREIEPDCGQPVSIVRLVMKSPKKAGLFDARLETGDSDRDRLLNKSGLALAAFYVLAVNRPSKSKPLMLAKRREGFYRLAALGLGAKGGRGDRLTPSDDSISKSIGRLHDVVPVLPVKGADERETGWFLKSGFPEVRVVGATGPQFPEWSWMEFNLRLALEGKPFLDRKYNRTEPLSDEQVQAAVEVVEAKKRKSAAARKGKARKTTASKAGAKKANAKTAKPKKRLRKLNAAAS